MKCCANVVVVLKNTVVLIRCNYVQYIHVFTETKKNFLSKSNSKCLGVVDLLQNAKMLWRMTLFLPLQKFANPWSDAMSITSGICIDRHKNHVTDMKLSSQSYCVNLSEKVLKQ